MTPVRDLLPGITHHSTEWWAEKDQLITERAKTRASRVRASAPDRAEDRDQRRIDEAQLLRDHPHLRTAPR